MVGLQSGDVLIEANGTPVSATNPIGNVVRESKGQPVRVKIDRGGTPMVFTVTPRREGEGDYLIGIRLGQVRAPVPFGQAAKEAIVLPAVASADMLRGLYEMVTGKQKASLSGPVGIAREMAKAADRGAVDFVQLMMLLSIYLGLFNLLPFPALDGGRVLFLGIGALRININAKTEAMVHMVGIILLLGVFVLVTFKDIKEIVVRFAN
jgi:regulator of sigma E protease